MKSGGGGYARARQYNFLLPACRERWPDRRFGSEASAPKPGARQTQSRLTTARANLRSSRLFLARTAARSFFGPAIGARARQTDLIENPPNHGVDNIDNGIRAAVKRWNSRKNDRAGFEKRDDVTRVNEVPGRFARHDNQFAAFLQENIGRAQKRTVTGARTDPPKGRH